MEWNRGLSMALAVLALGCASSRVTPTDTPTGMRTAAHLSKPDVLLVYDFAAGPNEFVVDTLGGDFESKARTLSKGDEMGRRAATAISKQLVARLTSRGIVAKRAAPTAMFPLNAIVIKGQIVTVDRGSRVRRVVLGFGAGSTELTAQVQAYQATRWGLLRVSQAEAQAGGPRTLGMAGPIGIGAAIGTAGTSAVVSGGLNLVSELRGGIGGIDACAGRVADGIAEKIHALYERQGWL